MQQNNLLIIKKSVNTFLQKGKPIFHFNSIFGLGFFKIRILLIFLGLNKNFSFSIQPLMTSIFILRLQLLIDQSNWLLEKSLLQRRIFYFRQEKNLKLYSFYRKKFNLPVRGQRSHSNRQTMQSFFKLNKLNFVDDSLINKKKNYKLSKKTKNLKLTFTKLKTIKRKK